MLKSWCKWKGYIGHSGHEAWYDCGAGSLAFSVGTPAIEIGFVPEVKCKWGVHKHQNQTQEESQHQLEEIRNTSL